MSWGGEMLIDEEMSGYDTEGQLADLWAGFNSFGDDDDEEQ